MISGWRVRRVAKQEGGKLAQTNVLPTPVPRLVQNPQRRTYVSLLPNESEGEKKSVIFNIPPEIKTREK